MVDMKVGMTGHRNALLDVLNRRPAQRRPMWFMRQAGRYLPEYRAVREKAGSFLDLCYHPELAADVTIQPLRRYDLDAAILFADILVVPHAMGLDLTFAEGEGPVLTKVTDGSAVRALKPVAESYQVKQVCRTVELTRSLLAPEKALIGFCGAPWTVASYMVGGGSSDRAAAKIAAYQRSDWFVELIASLVKESIDYLSAQARAGVQAVQIFDSWAGDLTGAELDAFVLKPIADIARGVKALHPDLPIIAFARGSGQRQPDVAKLPGVNAIGLETECDITTLPNDIVVQGNLDPVSLLAGADVATREAIRLCQSVDRSRHIFNLGHGIRLGTDPAVVGAVVDAVRSCDE